MGAGPHAPVVALVCSTGGLDAVRRILSRLPVGFPATVVVLQHQTPQADGRLAWVLSRWTALPVKVAAEGDRLRAGHVLVAPAGKHTLIDAGGHVALIDSGERPPYRPSADLLLTTLATAARRRAIAVVLSGSGNDGATGATAIHHFGGVVIAGDAATSTAFAMPYAAISRDQVVDHIAPVDQIPALLVTLLTGTPSTGPAASPPGVRSTAGLDHGILHCGRWQRRRRRRIRKAPPSRRCGCGAGPGPEDEGARVRRDG
jgi:two-component system, chemotaxis family, protein-glutamate methylesterase/glutaminase